MYKNSEGYVDPTAGAAKNVKMGLIKSKVGTPVV